jgi:excisionase family DNA binding protein
MTQSPHSWRRGASTDDPRLTRAEAASYLGLTKHTLEIWAVTGRYALPYVKIGNRTQYRKSDLDAFIERRTRRFDSGEAA